MSTLIWPIDYSYSDRIEVYDNGGRKGKDDLIGTAFYSLKQLEAAALLKTSLPLSDGKKKKPPGQLVVRSYRELK